MAALDIIKCLEQIKYQRLLPSCAPIIELPIPYNIDAMITIKDILKHIFKGAVHRFYIGGPRNRLQLRKTVYFKRFTFFPSRYSQFFGVTDWSKMVN